MPTPQISIEGQAKPLTITPKAKKPGKLPGGTAQGISERLLGPEAIAGNTQQLFQLLSSSPAFAQMLQQAGITGQQTNTALQGGLARTGLNTSGIGAVTSAVGNTMAQRGIGQARAQLFQQALQTALESLSQRLGAQPGLMEAVRAGSKPKTFFGQAMQGIGQGVGALAGVAR